MKTHQFLNVFLAALLGVVVGTNVATPRASANFFEDLLKGFTPPSIGLPKIQEKNQTTPYSPTVDYEQAVIKAVETASPSVVSVVISKNLPVLERCSYNPFSDLPPGFENFFGNDLGLTVPCDTGKKKLQEVGGGSGFVISSDGMILTNKHVVSDQSAAYTVLTNDGKKYDAKVLARDPLQDLAIIKITATDLPVLALGDSDSIKLGQSAIAIGNALGEFRNTVSVGVISGLSRTIDASGGGIGTETLQGVIQTDAAINPGNSGGPLLNLRGEVIGINSAVASGAQNIGFSIPINQAKRDIESVKKTGVIKTSYLGVRYVTITDDVVKSEKLPVDYGALLKSDKSSPAVVSGSPADKAGLKAQDIVLEINGEKLSGSKQLGLLIQKYSVGDTITLKVRRGDETLSFQVTLEERPK